MARYDIVIDTENGEALFVKQTLNRRVNMMRVLPYQNGLDNDNFCYLEISLPVSQKLSYTDGDSVLVRLPYHAIAKPAFVRFLSNNFNEEKEEYLINQKDNSIWFPVLQKTTEEPVNIYLSSLSMIDDNFLFDMIHDDGCVYVYSGNNTDLMINTSKEQNKNLLLMSRKGSLYQHPTSGVGLIDYINSDLSSSDLTEKLQSEFLGDGVVIINAKINTETGQLTIDVEE